MPQIFTVHLVPARHFVRWGLRCERFNSRELNYGNPEEEYIKCEGDWGGREKVISVLMIIIIANT